MNSGWFGGSANSSEIGTGWMIVRCLLRLYEASANSSAWLDSANRPDTKRLARSDSGIKVTSGEGSNAQKPLPVRNGLSNE